MKLVKFSNQSLHADELASFLVATVPNSLVNSTLLITRERSMNLEWKYDESGVDWNELSNLYKIAPLGEKDPKDLKLVFSNSRYKCFVQHKDGIVAVGRALSDGVDCSYLFDVAVHPDFQGHGLGKAVIQKLVEFSIGHKKIILYANPGKEQFYKRLGFSQMNTAMAIFKNHEFAVQVGLVSNA